MFLGVTSTTIESYLLEPYDTVFSVDIWKNSSSVMQFDFSIADPDKTSLSPSQLLNQSDMTIYSMNPSWVTFPSTGNLAGITNCYVTSGTHPLETRPLTVATAGDYTFRVTNTSPLTNQNAVATSYSPPNFQASGYPIARPLLILYSDYDPLNPDENIVGCNTGKPFNYVYPYVGTVVQSHNWPSFTKTLAVGTYTVVISTADTYAEGDPWFDEATRGSDQIATVQIWSVASSTPTPTPTPSPTSTSAVDDLAKTGYSNNSPLWGLVLILFGLLLIASSLKFRNRITK